MDEKLLFSVIIPTYNRAHLLPRAINSVINQSYDNFEIIIIDDGSKDNTREVVYSFSDDRINYYLHTTNKGVLAAENTGFNFSKGNYIALLGDDDELFPTALETAINQFKESNSKCIKILWFNCIDAESVKLSGKGPKKECDVTYTDLLCGKIEGDHWIVLDKDTIKNERFDERFWGGEDQLWLKLHRNFEAYYIPKILYKAYRMHGKRMSTANPMDNLSRIVLRKKAYLELFGSDLKVTCSRKYGSKLMELGFLQTLKGDKIESRKKLREALSYNFSLMCLCIYIFQYILSTNQIRMLYIKSRILYYKFVAYK